MGQRENQYGNAALSKAVSGRLVSAAQVAPLMNFLMNFRFGVVPFLSYNVQSLTHRSAGSPEQ